MDSTLIEQSKVMLDRDETLRATVMEIFANKSYLLQYLPFRDITVTYKGVTAGDAVVYYGYVIKQGLTGIGIEPVMQSTFLVTIRPQSTSSTPVDILVPKNPVKVSTSTSGGGGGGGILLADPVVPAVDISPVENVVPDTGLQDVAGQESSLSEMVVSNSDVSNTDRAVGFVSDVVESKEGKGILVAILFLGLIALIMQLGALSMIKKARVSE